MDPFFTEEQLNNMSRENMMEVMRIMQNQVQKKETEVQLLKDSKYVIIRICQQLYFSDTLFS